MFINWGCKEKSQIKSENDWKKDTDFKDFWEKVENSKINGHDELKDLLENNTKILIGDSIPNKTFWDKITGKSCSIEAKKVSTKETVEFENDKNNKKEETKEMPKDTFVEIDTVENIEYATVFRIILDNVYNGHELILHILDRMVKVETDCLKCVDNKKDAKIKINMNQIFNFSSKSHATQASKSLVRDLIDIQRERPGDNNIKRIFQHPVIEVLILKKWDDYKMPYIRDVRRFAFIVFLFTFFVRLRLVGVAKANCNPYNNLTTSLQNETSPETEEKRRELITNCGDWVDSGIPKENLTTCDSNYIEKNNATECNDLLLHAVFSWIFESDSHWAHNLLSGERSHLKYDWLLIFKYRKDHFCIFVTVMAGLCLIQLILFVSALFQYFTLSEQKSGDNSKTKWKMIKFWFINIFYLLLGNIVCFIPKSGPKLYLQVTVCVILAYLIFIEIVQIYILVRPAVRIYKSIQGKSGSIKSIIGNRYFRKLDNYLEIICFISIPVALFNETWSKTEGKDDADSLCRGIIAVGVFAGWMELFIKMGNVSHSVVGNFIKMFYNIIKSNLMAYMQACLLLMTAFSLAFWIILEGHIKKEGVNFSSGFWVNLVMTITMSVGEFNTTSFYEEIDENKIIKVFAMLFLIGLVIFSTITMVNLVMSAIIYDYGDMKKEVEIEHLYFIAEYIIEEAEYAIFNRYIKQGLCSKIYKLFQDDDHNECNEIKPSLEFCPRLVCINCELDPLPIPRPFFKYNPAKEVNEREPLLRRLSELRKGKSTLCEYHGGKTSEEILSELLELRKGKLSKGHGEKTNKVIVSEQNAYNLDCNVSIGLWATE